MSRNAIPSVTTPTGWRPSPGLYDALSDCLLAVADQRRAAVVTPPAHVEQGGGPDLSIFKEEKRPKKGKK